MDLFDKAKLQELKEMMGEDFAMLLDVYEEDSAQKMEELKASVASRDFTAIRESAHGLKGASANLGIDYIAAQAKLIEDAAKESNFTPIEPALAILVSVFPELKAQLAALKAV